MSKAKHTPGPWIAAKADLNGDVDPDPNRWAVLVDDGERQYFLATVENGAPGDTLATEEANARLIAAAPELLEACKAVLTHLNFSTTARADLKKQLRAAINKAEGAQDSQ